MANRLCLRRLGRDIKERILITAASLVEQILRTRSFLIVDKTVRANCCRLYDTRSFRVDCQVKCHVKRLVVAPYVGL